MSKSKRLRDPKFLIRIICIVLVVILAGSYVFSLLIS